MARYTITYACGHTADKQLFGPEAERQRYITWAAANARCEACCAADALSEVEAVEAEHQLPSLIGSDKQIAWARSIRVSQIKAAIKWIESSILPNVGPDKMDIYETQRAALLQGLYAKTRAAWWIEHSDDNGHALANIIATETAHI